MSIEVSDQRIDEAIRVNETWKALLYEAIETGRPSIPASQACDACLCAMGRWLDGPEFGPRLRETGAYRTLYRLHTEFHRSAGAILAYVERGNSFAAHFLLEGEFMDRSDDLVAALRALRTELPHPIAEAG